MGRFPVMSDRARPGLPARSHAPIPWPVAERAYAAYLARGHDGQSLERLAQRGGFGCRELDELAPGWEEECSETAQLKARIAVLERRLGQYECPEHEKPKFGECDTCDDFDLDESWRNVEP